MFRSMTGLNIILVLPRLRGVRLNRFRLARLRLRFVRPRLLLAQLLSRFVRLRFRLVQPAMPSVVPTRLLVRVTAPSFLINF